MVVKLSLQKNKIKPMKLKAKRIHKHQVCIPLSTLVVVVVVYVGSSSCGDSGS